MRIGVRNIQEEDLERIMHWRMDEDITRYMNTNPKLTLEKQKEWLRNISQNDRVRYWLIMVEGTPAGVISLLDIDWKNRTCSWGYYIGEKELRSLKLAISLEMSLYDYVFDILDFTELHNEIFSLNQGVIKLHLACGSHIEKEVTGEVVKEGIAYDITHMSITADIWNQIRTNKKYEQIHYDMDFKVHHIGYAVTDVWTALKGYRQIGYVPESGLIQDTDRKVNILFVKNRADQTLVELIAPMSDDSPVSHLCASMKGASTPYHICYEVDDLEASVQELKRRKFIPTTMIQPAVAFDNRRVVFMLKKEVGLIELLERGAVA